jgi:hypothetical protein
MSENRFDVPPANGIQVVLTKTGPALTPYHVVVTENGRLIKDETFTSERDALRLRDQEQKAALNRRSTTGICL